MVNVKKDIKINGKRITENIVVYENDVICYNHLVGGSNE